MATLTLTAVNCAANFLITPLLSATSRNTTLVFVSCLFSSVAHASRSKLPKVAFATQSLDTIPSLLVSLSLYSSGLSFTTSCLAALTLDAIHKKVAPDLINRSLKISHLPSYAAARFLGAISTIQSLFHFCVHLGFQSFGYFQKRKLLGLLQMLQSTNAVGRQEIQRAISALPSELRYQIYQRIYLNSKVSSDDPNWGVNHALDDLPALEKAIKQTIEMPYTLYLENSLREKSHRYALEGSKPASGATGFVNGMGLYSGHAKNFDASAVREAYKPGEEMQGVYLATHGLGFWGVFYDYLQAILGLSHQPTSVVLEIHAMWNDFFE